MTNDASQPDFWLERWSEDRIGFHRESVGHSLQTFGEEVLGRDAKTLVPLCGKSVDLHYLRELGHEVHGVEIAEKAAIAFFEESNLDVSIAATGAKVTPKRRTFSAGGRHIHVADFFALTPDHLGGPCTRWFDRAALIAMPPHKRGEYVAQVRSLLAPGAVGLVVTLEYDESEMTGPPFCVLESEVREHLADAKLEIIARRDVVDDEPRWREKGLTRFEEVT